MDSRGALVHAAKALVWERGVAATSPNALLDTAGVGQGSLYHHFRKKEDWALAAIEALADDLQQTTLDVLGEPAEPGVERLRNYLAHPRAARAGCRLGRLAFDPAVAADPSLRAPITAYFVTARHLLSVAVRDAVRDGALRADIDPDDLAAVLVAAVQGGYVLARADNDDEAMTTVVRGMRALLDAAA